MMRKNRKIQIISLLALCATCAMSGVFALNAYTAKADSEAIFHELGASVRVSSDKGIRFAFGLPEEVTGDDYEIGTLIIPKAVLGDGVLNHNDDPADEVDVSYAHISCSKNWVPNDKIDNAKEGYKYYNAALTEIPQLNYDTTLVARSYYVKNGVYTYSDPVERSMGYVAAAALNDGYEDTNNILADIVTTAYGETALNIEATEDIIGLGETTALVAENEKNYLPIWSVANPSVVNIDKTGTVTAVAGGMTTVTAQIGSVSATKDIYVASADLKGTEFNKVSWGWNNAGLSTTAIENGYSIAVKFAMGAGGDGYWLNLSQPKSYYEKLAEAGYKLTFDLAVTGHSGDGYCGDFNWPLIKVFGKTLEEYGFTSGTGKVTVSMDALVAAYDMQAQFLGGQVSDVAQTNYWFTIDRKDDYDRYFNLAITNYEYVKPVELAFVNASDVLVDASQIIQLDVVTNVPANEIAWKSSDDSVATVENGVVTGVKGGVATITASAGDVTISKTVYVAGVELKGSDFNKYSWTSNNAGLTTTEVENGYSIAVKFNTGAAGDGYWLTLSQPKSYYEKLAEEGYALSFDLAVAGHSGDNYYGEFNWPLIKVFGKTLEEYGFTSGQGTIIVGMDALVAAYDMQAQFVAGGISGSAVAQNNYWFTLDRKDDYARFFNLTITNYEYVKPELALENTEDVVIGKAETLAIDVVTNISEKGIIWGSSNTTVATVENGVVTGVSGGVATITATVGDITVSKTVYVASADLKATDFNKYSWNSNNALSPTAIANGYSLAVKFNTGAAGDGYWMNLSQPKSYYEKLAAEGYVLTFDLSVTGHSGDNYYGEFNWPLIKVFGKTLEEYGFTSGTGKVTVNMSALVAAYDIQAALATNSASNVAQSNYWFTLDRKDDYARFFNFAITNYMFVKA
jgi:uncharacterized protein YjdB